MRVALFITCFNDTLFPEAGRAVGDACSSGSGTRSSSPREQTCCGQMHANTGYQRRGAPAGAPLRARRSATRSAVVVAVGAPASAMVRDQYRTLPSWRRRPGLARAVDGARPAVFELSRVPRRRARRRGRRRLLPAPGHLPPDLPLAAAAARRRRARCGCCARCAGSTWSSCPSARSAAASAARSRSRTPTRRWRCWPTSCAASSTRGAEVCTAGDNSCLMHIGGGLRAPAGRRAHAPPRRDPRAPTRRRMTDGFPAAGARRRWRDAQLRRNMRQGHRDDPRQARARSSRSSPDWEALREAGARDQGRARCATSTSTSSSSRRSVAGARRRGPLGARRGRGERDRRAASSASARRRRGRQGQVADHRRDRPQRRRSPRAGITAHRDRPGRADRAARRRPAVAHPRARDPPEPRRDPRAVRAHARRGAET